MSHLHEREEKVCLNCGTQLAGRYCQNCGQENVEPKETTWHLVVHFFNDVTHFDGKLFSTLKPLLLKPGFLTEEYVKGRRASYLNPIRMYLFISAVFFLVLTKFIVPVNHIHVNEDQHTETKHTTDTTKEEPKHSLAKQIKAVSDAVDSLVVYDNNKLIPLKNGDTFTEVQVNSYNPASIEAYDSLQHLLPDNEKDDGLTRYLAQKTLTFNEKKKKEPKEFTKEVLSSFLHSIPSLLFFSLPLIALMFRLLYIRRKQYYYVSHGIFVIHYFCFLFIGLIFYYAAARVPVLRPALSVIVPVGLLVYLFAAMKRFYKQGWFKTSVKFLLLLSMVFIFSIVFLIGSVIAAFLEVG